MITAVQLFTVGPTQQNKVQERKINSIEIRKEEIKLISQY